jgi:hypothetical protein
MTICESANARAGHALIIFSKTLASAKSFKDCHLYKSNLAICCGALDLGQAAS